MRQIETALWPLERPTPELGQGVLLGEVSAASLAGLSPGERVLLVEPNELEVEATVRLVEVDGQKIWFGELGDSAAIQVIYPGPGLCPD